MNDYSNVAKYLIWHRIQNIEQAENTHTQTHTDTHTHTQRERR